MRANKDYEKKVHKILKTYNSILVKCKNIPLLSDKNIVMVENIDSMINAQIETRKPILYFQEEKSIALMLLDGTESYIYVLKANDGIISEVEQVINNFEYARNTFVKDILSKIEKVLLSGSIEKEKVLTANELKYLESIKENSETKSKVEQTTLQNNLSMQNGTEKDDNNIANLDNIIETNEKPDNNSDNLYLVPVKKKKKITPFNKNKKSKRLNSKKNGRRRKIG